MAAHGNELIEEIPIYTVVMAVNWGHIVLMSDRVVGSNGVAQSAGSVAGFTAEQVEEVRMVVRMFPIFLTTIFYWTIYSQVHPLVLTRLHLPVSTSTAGCILFVLMCLILLPMFRWTL